ncbi:unannotated protein [freshwater metagenome]|uniref:Unannotated protein n=1 Tax=freshwater metagenome TaxID=449393 RepID=A0A6J5YP43_9ZZZZ|nr:hypothetical protein [Actinomycetota bacterium]
MRKTLAAALVLVLSFAVPTSAQAVVKEGATCKTINKLSKTKTNTFVCLRSGGKLILVPKYKKCADAVAAGRAPIVIDEDPVLYLANQTLDRDKDGTACDS